VLNQLNMWGIANRTRKIAELFLEAGEVYYVGGCVRDSLLGKKSQDIDMEIHGVDIDFVRNTLIAAELKFSEVGKSFGVFKIKHGSVDVDLSLPRKDSKTFAGHKGFNVTINPHLGITEALRRRDFTINAIACRVFIGPEYFDDEETDPIPFSSEWRIQYYDPFGGKNDLENKILKMVDSDTFKDDPLRVLRGVQFAARFDLTVEEETFNVMKQLV